MGTDFLLRCISSAEKPGYCPDIIKSLIWTEENQERVDKIMGRAPYHEEESKELEDFLIQEGKAELHAAFAYHGTVGSAVETTGKRPQKNRDRMIQSQLSQMWQWCGKMDREGLPFYTGMNLYRFMALAFAVGYLDLMF